MGRTHHAAILALVLVAAPGAAHAVAVLSGPTLTMDPSGGHAPLAGLVEFTTDVPVIAQLTISYQSEVRVIDFPEATTDQRLPVLGLKPDRTYSVDLEITPGGPIGSFLATTGPLPADFPTLVTTVSLPQQMEPGYTWIDCLGRGPNPGGLTEYTAIVDAAGDVVWYSDRCYEAVEHLDNGWMLRRNGNQAAMFDLLELEQRRVVLQITWFGIHHDLQLTPHGTFLSLARRGDEVLDFPTSETDPNAPPATQTVRADPVMEYFPDGTLRREWSLLELLQPTRIGYDSLKPSNFGRDWGHPNAVIYDPADDSIVVSVRHQDALVNFSRSSGALRWILANHENWSSAFQPFLLTPVGTPFRWQFHQHSPMWTGDGTLLLFDNGNHRASPFDGTTPLERSENFSRAVEYAIDEQTMQVEQVWEFGENGAERLYSTFVSDADWLPTTGNRLITFSGITHVDGQSSASLGLGAKHTRIIETTDETPAATVFDLRLSAANGDEIRVYRSKRLADLYPSQRIDPPNGIGTTLRIGKQADEPRLSWAPPPTDSGHDAAGHYMIYRSDVAADGFEMVESIAALEALVATGQAPMSYLLVVAGNVSGTSPDLPTP